MISTSLSADNPSSYDDTFLELTTTPVSQLDFRIQQLEYRIKKFKKSVSYRLIDSYDSGFRFGFDGSIKICDKVNCKKDPSNLKIVVCEIFIENGYDFSDNRMDIKTKVEKVKFIYSTILNLAKETIHKSFDKSHLRVIMKIEMPLSEQEMPEKYEDFEEIFISHTPEEKTLVIFENGLPQYEDAFFDN